RGSDRDEGRRNTLCGGPRFSSTSMGAEHAGTVKRDGWRSATAVSAKELQKRKHARTRKRSAELDVEPMTGIEPAYSAWEADVLPLNYIGIVVLTCKKLRPAGVIPRLSVTTRSKLARRP